MVYLSEEVQELLSKIRKMEYDLQELIDFKFLELYGYEWDALARELKLFQELIGFLINEINS